MREHYYLPTFEEISAKMAGSKKFSILDASQAFWQIRLSEDSVKYTTFNTPYGRYCFLRMPYGISSTPEVFHRCFSQIFNDIKGVEIFIDDLMIHAKDDKEHDEILNKVFERARRHEIRFNRNKSKIGLEEIKYIGHIFSRNGIKVDNEKIQVILEMKKPGNVKNLESFLGMITYVSRYIPNVSQLH